MNANTSGLPRFHVTIEDGDRTLYLDGTPILVGWIERGQVLTDLHRTWTEWRFTPARPSAPAGPVRQCIADAYNDARRYAAEPS